MGAVPNVEPDCNAYCEQKPNNGENSCTSLSNEEDKQKCFIACLDCKVPKPVCHCLYGSGGGVSTGSPVGPTKDPHKIIGTDNDVTDWEKWILLGLLAVVLFLLFCCWCCWYFGWRKKNQVEDEEGGQAMMMAYQQPMAGVAEAPKPVADAPPQRPHHHHRRRKRSSGRAEPDEDDAEVEEKPIKKKKKEKPVKKPAPEPEPGEEEEEECCEPEPDECCEEPETDVCDVCEQEICTCDNNNKFDKC